jgi:hypothetical protein
MLRSSAFILFLLFANLPKKNMRSPLLYIANNYIVIIDETKAFMPCPKHNIYNSGHLEMRSLTCFELFKICLLEAWFEAFETEPLQQMALA